MQIKAADSNTYKHWLKVRTDRQKWIEMKADYMLQCHSAPSNLHNNKILDDLNA